MSEFSIRRATAHDDPTVEQLLQQMFRGDVSERLSWLYRGNPHGRAVTWLAERAGQAVGVTSIFPRRVRVAGRAHTGAIGGDCYIVPAARRKGLATLLHRATQDGMKEAGIDFMYGPPLARNLGALLKAGSRAVGALRRYTRPITTEAVAHAMSRTQAAFLAPAARFLGPPIRLFDALTSAAARGLRLSPVEHFDERFEGLAHDDRTDVIVPVRDPAFLEWRYLTPGLSGLTPLAIEGQGRLLGFAAVEIRDGGAIVVDLYSQKARVDAGALALLVKFARDRGCHYIDYYGTGAGVDRRTLKMLGFAGREERVFQVLAATGLPETPLLFDPAAWLFTEGDKDTATAFSSEPD